MLHIDTENMCTNGWKSGRQSCYILIQKICVQMDEKVVDNHVTYWYRKHVYKGVKKWWTIMLHIDTENMCTKRWKSDRKSCYILMQKICVLWCSNVVEVSVTIHYTWWWNLVWNSCIIYERKMIRSLSWRERFWK